MVSKGQEDTQNWLEDYIQIHWFFQIHHKHDGHHCCYCNCLCGGFNTIKRWHIICVHVHYFRHPNKQTTHWVSLRVAVIVLIKIIFVFVGLGVSVSCCCLRYWWGIYLLLLLLQQIFGRLRVWRLDKENLASSRHLCNRAACWFNREGSTNLPNKGNNTGSSICLPLLQLGLWSFW